MWARPSNTAREYRFEEGDLEKTVFFNTDAFGKPVKTAIFMGGFEFEQYMNLIEAQCPDFEQPDFDAETFSLLAKAGSDERFRTKMFHNCLLLGGLVGLCCVFGRELRGGSIESRRSEIVAVRETHPQ